MSFNSTGWRTFARSGLGAAGSFRGALCAAARDLGLPTADPQVLGLTWLGQIGSLIYRSPGPSASRALIGVTVDQSNTPQGGCTVRLYHGRGTDYAFVSEVVSDASGNFRFENPGTGPYYVRAYLPGAPDVAGVSSDLLMPT